MRFTPGCWLPKTSTRTRLTILATFKTQIDLLSDQAAAALDGGKKAIAERNHQAKVVIRMLRQLGHYVEANCNDNLQTFLKSGFEAAPGTRTPSQALSQFIRRIDPGKISGQFMVVLAAILGAVSYELKWGAVGAGGAVTTWTTQPVARIRPPVTLTGLTPGTTYAFQVRALTTSGYTDWSESVTRICV
jgi:hypothetical protein